jgi:hypothetical protein
MLDRLLTGATNVLIIVNIVMATIIVPMSVTNSLGSSARVEHLLTVEVTEFHV